MKHDYKYATCIYKNNKDEELNLKIFKELDNLGVVRACSKENKTVCEVVFNKDQIHNKIKFDTLVIIGAKGGDEVYHILKHKSLFNNVENIYVNYADDNCDKFNHRNWKEDKRIPSSNNGLLYSYHRK